MKKFLFFCGVMIFPMVLVSGCVTTTKSGSTHQVYGMPSNGDDIVGESFSVRVRPDDNLSRIGARYDVGLQEMIDANPHVDPKHLRIGQRVTVPAQYVLPPKKYRDGIVINVPELRLYYFSPDGNTVATYPVALGREKWRTPIGSTTVVRKAEAPVWRVPKSIRDHVFKTQGELLPLEVPPGEDNPLGDYAIYLGMSGYLIHGTNAPQSVGQLISSGCVRMYNQDVKQLYKQVTVGTPVHIIHYPNKAGWRDGELYLEAHKSIADDSGAYQRQAISATEAVTEALAGRKGVINSKVIEQIVASHRGAPRVIGKAMTH